MNFTFAFGLTKSKFSLFPFLLSFSIFCSAQDTGSLSGMVKDGETGDTLYGATVFLLDTKFGMMTDGDGNYMIKDIPPGTYTVVFDYSGYVGDTIRGVKINSGENTILNQNMSTDLKEQDEIVVYVKRTTGTVANTIQEIKTSDNVVSGISQEQISKGQDRDAGEVVRRIPGVTVVDNRFIQIRGLSERYNTVWLNNANAPSSETDKKSFSFDLIPTGLIDRILVFKTPSPELPGDFAGGLVKVYTRNASEGRRVTVNYSSSYRAGTTFKNFTSDLGTNKDLVALGAKDRNLPENFPVINSSVTNSEKNQLAKQLKNNWGIKDHKAFLDQRFSAVYNDSWNIGKLKLYNITSVNYSNTNTNFNIKRSLYDATGGKTDVLKDQQFTNNVRLGLLQNFTLSFNPNHKVEFRNFFNQAGRNQTTIRKSFDNNDTQIQQSYQLGYQARGIYSGQVAGTHLFNKERTSFNWLGGYSYSSKNEPDLRRLSYTLQTYNDTTHYKAQVSQSATPTPNSGRLYQKLNEKIYTFSANIEHKVKIKSYEFDVKAGTYLEDKSRQFNARLIGYYFVGSQAGNNFYTHLNELPIGEIFAPQNVGVDTAFRISEDINSTYNYTGSNKLRAGYVSFNLPYKKKLNLVTGVRYEHNLQSIKTADITGNPINANVKTSLFLPSANLSYNFSEKKLLRFAYGKTLNRPEFREWAPFAYYDFDFQLLNYGSLYINPTRPLKTAVIDNFDLRYEIYPSPSENIHIGAFYKRFLNPIETTVIPTSNLAYSYTNATSAYIQGIELDIRKNLAPVDSLLNTRVFGQFSMLFNASLIQSRVSLPENTLFWNKNRSLQGQSPYVFNAGLYYQNDSINLQVTLAYNVFGPRIVFVGFNQYPDVVELPRHTVDLTISKKISNKIAVNAGVTDLFNQSVIYVQDFNHNQKYERGVDQRLLDFKRGRYFSLGVMVRL